MQQTWKAYLRVISLSFITFYLVTFGVAYYYMHRSDNEIFTIALIICYVLFVFSGTIRMIKKLPMQVIMLLAPTAPLFALIIVVTFIPILQNLK